ncbi:cupin domain-containing protein [Enterovibrio sp. ZSDZ42]|uniref:Cupin domain-containing protein n=1 Tax=Enterovibrio gelatinilyticus TaxID=2899819 RepID=A0ABT5R0J1_9GAMM|nr:cupin domain-containing protein [Enterovibrio sp. ZSDZ42]MDD1793786.1 cupin domain-containing protein [Enterovibrio sp. ZSDZ42]
MKGTRINLTHAFEKVSFLQGRTPEHALSNEGEEAFATLSPYRDGGVFIAYYDGKSEWERHPGDELVQIIEGQTTVFLLENGEERPVSLSAGEMIVVPEMVWHRFDTPNGVKVLTITPQPTEHSIETPVTYG